MDTKKEIQHLNLRQRAKSALKNGQLELDKLSLEQSTNIEKMLEEFRIYQAELELQNEELIQSQSEFQQISNQYKTLFKYLPIAALVLDYHSVISDANEKAWKSLGFSSINKCLNHSFYRLIYKEDREKFYTTFHHINKLQNAILPFHLSCIGSDVTPVEGHFICLPEDYHLEHYVLLLLIDKSYEEQQQKERLLFQSMLDNSPSMMVAFDNDNRYILANKAFYQNTLCSPKQILGHTREVWLNHQETLKNKEFDDEVRLSGNPSVHEEFFAFPNGLKSYFANTRFPLRNNSGDIFGVGLVKTNIGEILSIKNRLQAILGTSPFCIKLVDKNGTILSMNQTGLELIEVDNEEQLKHKSIYPFIIEKYRRAYQDFNEWICCGHQGKIEYEMMSLKGSLRWMETHAVAFELENGETVQLAFSQDICERKQKELELQTAKKRLFSLWRGIQNLPKII